jgi:hypothetical protein
VLSLNNIAVRRNAKAFLASPIKGSESELSQDVASKDIRQLKRRINSTTHGKLSVVSGFERFKCDLAASLKLFFIWSFGANECASKGHVLMHDKAKGYKPKCGRCGKKIQFEDLNPYNV